MKYIIITCSIAVVVVGLLYVAFVRSFSQPVVDGTTMNQNELKIEDITVGSGAEAKAGSTVSVNYTGTLLNGAKFDSSYDRGTPFSFTIGNGQVITGWEQGIPGMKIGGKRRLTVPAALAYGDRAVGNSIPANSTLVFEVELLDVK